MFAAALLVLSGALALPAAAQTTDPVWSATMTAGETRVGHGYDATDTPDTPAIGALDDDDFDYGSLPYRVLAIDVATNVVRFAVEPGGQLADETLTLEFGGHALAFSDRISVISFGLNLYWLVPAALDDLETEFPVGSPATVCLRTDTQVCPAGRIVTPAANAAPAFSSSATFDAAENQTTAGTVLATDSDAGDDVTGYAITGGADQNLFSIGTTSGALTFDDAPNFEDAKGRPGGLAAALRPGLGRRLGVLVRLPGPAHAGPVAGLGLPALQHGGAGRGARHRRRRRPPDADRAGAGHPDAGPPLRPPGRGARTLLPHHHGGRPAAARGPSLPGVGRARGGPRGPRRGRPEAVVRPLPWAPRGRALSQRLGADAMRRHVLCSALVVATLTLAACSLACVQTQDAHSPAAQALADLRATAEAGAAAAQFILGGMYVIGVGVPQDDVEAVAWYRRAAEQGHARAQYNLGAMYAEGLGVPPDAAAAVAWYRRAAEQGAATAQNNLGAMYAEGLGVPPDAAAAVAWYRRAAEQGDATAQSNLGRMYDQGLGVPQDDVEAVAWYRRAAEQGDARAVQPRGHVPRGPRRAAGCRRRGRVVPPRRRAGPHTRAVQPRGHVCRGPRRTPGCRRGPHVVDHRRRSLNRRGA